MATASEQQSHVAEDINEQIVGIAHLCGESRRGMLSYRLDSSLISAASLLFLHSLQPCTRGCAARNRQWERACPAKRRAGGARSHRR